LGSIGFSDAWFVCLLDQAKWHNQQQANVIKKLTAVLSTAGANDADVAGIQPSPPPDAPIVAVPDAPVAVLAVPSSTDQTARLCEATSQCF